MRPPPATGASVPGGAAVFTTTACSPVSSQRSVGRLLGTPSHQVTWTAGCARPALSAGPGGLQRPRIKTLGTPPQLFHLRTVLTRNHVMPRSQPEHIPSVLRSQPLSPCDLSPCTGSLCRAHPASFPEAPSPPLASISPTHFHSAKPLALGSPCPALLSRVGECSLVLTHLLYTYCMLSHSSLWCAVLSPLLECELQAGRRPHPHPILGALGMCCQGMDGWSPC